MSYSLIGNFFINNELVQAANLDRLKVLNERRYSSSLKNVDPINYVADCFGELPDNGYMYNVTSFENALEIEKKNYISLKREFNKLKNLFYVFADVQVVDGHEEFFYKKAEIYTNPDFNLFLNMLDAGEIMYDIRMGSYSDGRPHDHGSAFRIKGNDVFKLYSTKEEVE